MVQLSRPSPILWILLLFRRLSSDNLFRFFSYSLLIGMITKRCLFLFVLHIFLLCFGNICVGLPPSLLPPPPAAGASNYLLNESNDIPTKGTVFLNSILFFLLILVLWLLILLYQVWLHMSRKTYYVPFDTNLNLFRKDKKNSMLCLYSFLWYSSASFLALVLLSEYENTHFFLAVSPNIDFLSFFEQILQVYSKFKKTISTTLSVIYVLIILSTATTPNTQYVCICVLQIVCLSSAKEMPPWLSALLIIISNDIEKNPGPVYHSNFFNFMNWNLNSLATNDFSRVQLIEAHNSIHN